MSNEKFDPVKEFTNIRDTLSRAVEQGVKGMTAAGNYPRMDIYETKTEVVVRSAPIDGIKPESIEVSMEDGVLTVSGETEADRDIPEEAVYLVQERYSGVFSRSLRITRPVKADSASAKIQRGMLTITLPKIEDKRPQVIDVTPAE